MTERITNDEVFALTALLSEMKVCQPGTIPPPAADKLISLTCDLQEAAMRLQKRIDMIREQTRPEGVPSWGEASEEQRAAWNRAMTGQLELLGGKAAGVAFEPLAREEFAAVIAANTLTGRQAVLLRRTLLASEGTETTPDKTGSEPAPEQKGGEE